MTDEAKSRQNPASQHRANDNGGRQGGRQAHAPADSGQTKTRSKPRFQHTGRHKARAARRDSWSQDPVLFGHHAVAFALANPDRRIKRLLLTENAERKLADLLREHNPEIDRASPKDLDRLLGADTVHQGAMAEVEHLPEPELQDLIARSADAGPLVVLDQVTDPQNVGAVLRSAAVFGAVGLVITRRNSPPLHGVLGKAASGALDLVPVCLVQNLARALEEMGDAGVLRVGLDGEADQVLHDAITSGPLALVLGAEGKGLRQATQEHCDRLARISATGPIASLNVSNAAAVSLHMAALKRTS